MSNGYMASALKLSAISHEDRMWVLARLDPEDRSVILDALTEIAVPVAGKMAGYGPVSDRIASQDYSGSDQTTKILLSADVDTMSEVLGNEPTWVVALVVCDARYPWVSDYLSRLKKGDLLHLQNVVASTVRTVRPRVRRAILELVSGRVVASQVMKPVENTFDRLVTELRRKSDVSQEHDRK